MSKLASFPKVNGCFDLYTYFFTFLIVFVQIFYHSNDASSNVLFLIFIIFCIPMRSQEQVLKSRFKKRSCQLTLSERLLCLWSQVMVIPNIKFLKIKWSKYFPPISSKIKTWTPFRGFHHLHHRNQKCMVYDNNISDPLSTYTSMKHSLLQTLKTSTWGSLYRHPVLH